jgi:sulfite dehydrogenase (quinone) subunit SoeC
MCPSHREDRKLMKQRHDTDPSTVNGEVGPTPVHPLRVGPMLLQVFAFTGYGLWMLLGLALAMGIYRSGRGDALVPLALGGALICVGLVAACLRTRWMPVWHGWRIGDSPRPTREALLALATFLPMLAVAGLARGDNAFWATRLAGAVLSLCSLATLVLTARGDIPVRVPHLDSRLSAQLPLSRVVSAAYCGGMWLWLCVIGQEDGAVYGASTLPWIIGLLLLALLRGLVEGMRWQTLLARLPRPPTRLELQPRRYLAATLAYALPCVALLLTSFDEGRLLLSGLAAVSCMFGLCMELSLYDGALPTIPANQ